ncbi:isopentenyl-diphosphate Delta-isomerase [Pseudorhodobacter wandonensis]|uniref:isopentenyl-diphosphate Delta-isomerase n=1 Tax=Pseudorhodobacter wandonensis TaxID=1120568 RepID=UPI00067C4788|nr:isopentenyl-diphosphate Delta-isomerase [Pseudorhodobacter wandonensis]
MDLIPAWIEGVLQPVEKLAVHQRGLQHKAVSVFVLAGDRLLIQQRAAGKYHTPNLWANTCCTHPHWDEAHAACAHRRLVDELGIAGLDLRAVGEVRYRADVGVGLTEDEVVAVFVAEAGADLAMTLNPDEVQAVRWVAIDALLREIEQAPEVFTPWLRIYLTKHRTQILGA